MPSGGANDDATPLVLEHHLGLRGGERLEDRFQLLLERAAVDARGSQTACRLSERHDVIVHAQERQERRVGQGTRRVRSSRLREEDPIVAERRRTARVRVERHPSDAHVAADDPKMDASQRTEVLVAVAVAVPGGEHLHQARDLLRHSDLFLPHGARVVHHEQQVDVLYLAQPNHESAARLGARLRVHALFPGH